jgi:hypothetical protein
VPDDFDTMDQEEIEKLFYGDEETNEAAARHAHSPLDHCPKPETL